jgi:hypothetical protein
MPYERGIKARVQTQKDEVAKRCQKAKRSKRKGTIRAKREIPTPGIEPGPCRHY